MTRHGHEGMARLCRVGPLDPPSLRGGSRRPTLHAFVLWPHIQMSCSTSRSRSSLRASGFGLRGERGSSPIPGYESLAWAFSGPTRELLARPVAKSLAILDLPSAREVLPDNGLGLEVSPSMKLIVQIPCYNEASTLAIALDALPRQVQGFDVASQKRNGSACQVSLVVHE